MKKKLTANMEDYLEAIYVLELEKGNVRVKDVSLKMGLTMPSVSGALKRLEKQGFVQHPKYDLIGLTFEGGIVAEQIYRRHQIIRDFLNKVLGLKISLAEKDACNMEHVISPETEAGFTKLLKIWEQRNAAAPEFGGGCCES